MFKPPMPTIDMDGPPPAVINLNSDGPTVIDRTGVDNAEDNLYTCLSCAVAFLSPDEQREHMKSDWHRYNMKVRSASPRGGGARAHADFLPRFALGLWRLPQRRVATLPPVTAALFNRKVIERRNENAVTATKHGETCTLCA